MPENELRAARSDRFVAAVEQIYAAAALPAQWPAALQAIGTCFDDPGSLLIYQRDDGSFGTFVAPGLAAAQRDYEQNGWWRQDLRFIRSVERGYLANLDTISDRHVATEEEIEGHPFYAQFLRAHGLKWFAGSAMSPDPHVGVALSVQRSADRPAYSDEELAVAARLARHVENALRLSIRLINAELVNLALADALARVGVGVFLIDADGRIMFANLAGEKLIGRGLQTVRGRLTASFAGEREALETAVTQAIGARDPAWSDNPRPVVVRGLDTNAFLAAYVMPIRHSGGGRLEQLLAGIRAIVVVTESKAGDPPDPAMVRDLLGLTLGEARVATLVGSGLAPRESAQKLGIAEETARTTLKRVFDKVGISRQSELVGLLTRLVLR
jgi:DNA-binding CsgD family transcriptional regulator